MTLQFESINYLAVIVAAIAAFVVGGVWYGAIFGKAWPRLYGYDEAELQSMAKSQGRTFAIFFVAYLVMAFVFALLLTLFEAPTLGFALLFAFLLWLGVGATDATLQKAAHRQAPAVWAMDATHHLLALLVIAAIIGAWR